MNPDVSAFLVDLHNSNIQIGVSYTSREEYNDKTQEYKASSDNNWLQLPLSSTS